jgi:hypothetical protein
VVTTYVLTTVSARVVGIEAVLALINRQAGAGHDVLQGTRALISALTQGARALTAASHEFSALVPPYLGLLPTLHLKCMLEDLAVYSDQLATLLDEAAAPVTTSDYLAAATNIAYWPRVRSALALLRRAEGWLEAVDHETGAHATLPGFAPGAPSLESQLALQ